MLSLSYCFIEGAEIFLVVKVAAEVRCMTEFDMMQMLFRARDTFSTDQPKKWPPGGPNAFSIERGARIIVSQYRSKEPQVAPVRRSCKTQVLNV